MMKKIILIISIMLMKLLVLKAEPENYQFSCTYDKFAFDFDDNYNNDNFKKYKLQVDVYKDEIKIFLQDGKSNPLLKSRTYLSTYGIEIERGFTDNGIVFEYQNDPSLFYSNGKLTCPRIVYDFNVVENMDMIMLRFDDASNIPLPRAEFSATKGPWGGIANESDIDEVVMDCKIGENEYPYYYADMSYDEIFFEGGLFRFNIIKYKSGKIEFNVLYADNFQQTLKYENNQSSSFSIDGKYTIKFKDMNNLETCPSQSDLYFCQTDKKNFIITQETSNCKEPEKAAQFVDEKTAKTTRSDLFDLIDSNISTKPSSCEQLLGGKNSNLIKYLQSAWTIVKIGAIIITIIMAIIDFMTVITKEKDELKECLNKNIKRLIIVIIILLMPTIIDFIGSTIFNSNNILCGIK